MKVELMEIEKYWPNDEEYVDVQESVNNKISELESNGCKIVDIQFCHQHIDYHLDHFCVMIIYE